jgi:hypothetical protein
VPGCSDDGPDAACEGERWHATERLRVPFRTGEIRRDPHVVADASRARLVSLNNINESPRAWAFSFDDVAIRAR